MNRRSSDKWQFLITLPIYSVVMVIGYMFYSATAPVVTDFEVNQQYSNNDFVVISGTMNKVRNCRFDSLFITSQSDGISTRHNFTFKDVEDSLHLAVSSRQSGLQYYGPWRIDANPDQRPLEIKSLHVCDFGLYTSTLLAVIE